MCVPPCLAYIHIYIYIYTHSGCDSGTYGVKKGIYSIVDITIAIGQGRPRRMNLKFTFIGAIQLDRVCHAVEKLMYT